MPIGVEKEISCSLTSNGGDSIVKQKDQSTSSTRKSLFWVILVLLPISIAWWGKDTLGISMGLSLLSYLVSDLMIGRVGPMLAEAGRTGTDLNKPNQPRIPESLGVVVGTVYLVSLFL